MNIHQLNSLLAVFIMLLSHTRYVDCELDWIEFCYNATIATVTDSSGGENSGDGNTDNGNNGNGNGNNGNGNGNNGNGNGNNGNGNGNNGNGNGNNGNGNGNNGNGNGNNGNGNGNNGNGNGNNGNGNGNNGNGNSNNGNANNDEANDNTYIQTICDTRIFSIFGNCTDINKSFTPDSVGPNSGEMVLEKRSVTNLDCTQLCAFLSDCVFFTYETSVSSCQIYIVGSDIPSLPVVWRKSTS